MPKFFTLDGSTVREAKKVFVNDNGTIREAKKIFALNAPHATAVDNDVKQVFDSFSVAFRGSVTVKSSANTNMGFNFNFATGQGIGTPTYQGTWDPAVGDIILLGQVHQRTASMGVATPSGYTNLDGHSIWYEGGDYYQVAITSFIFDKGGGYYQTLTYNAKTTASIAYRVLTGANFATNGNGTYSGSHMTDLVGACSTQGFNAGGGQGAVWIAQLYRPTATGWSIAGTQVNPTPTPIQGSQPNQTITGVSDDAVIQWAFGASSSLSTLDQAFGQVNTNTNVTTATTSGANSPAAVSGSLRTGIRTGVETATGNDRGRSNFLFSGSIRITAP